VNICATFRKPDLLGYWTECDCADCSRMRDALAAAGNPRGQPFALGPEKHQSREDYITRTVGRLERL
jgi:hypothetical protein